MIFTDLFEVRRLHVGDPVIVTAPNEYEGKTGELAEYSPSGSFVIVKLYNGDEASMHLSDIEYNEYADEEEADEFWDSEEDGFEQTLETTDLAEEEGRVDPILLKALKRMPDGLATHHQVLDAAYDAYAMELGYLSMKGNHGVTDVYIPKLMSLYKDKHGLTFNEAEEKLKVSPHDQGSYAAIKGKPYTANPFPAGSKEHLAWSKGHNSMRSRKADLDETYMPDTNYSYTVVVDGEAEGTYDSAEEAKDVVRKLRTQAPGHNFKIKQKTRTSARSIKKHFSNRSIDEMDSQSVKEGAIDELEQRRIDLLNYKMDEIFARAAKIDKSNPEAIRALMKQFEILKAERDSYYKIKESKKKEISLKHRDPNYAPLTAKRTSGAGGAHINKKKAQQQGDVKHRGRELDLAEAAKSVAKLAPPIKLFQATIRVKMPDYTGNMDVNVTAPNINMARQMVKAMYKIQNNNVINVKELKTLHEAEGTPEGLPRLTKELLSHIVDQIGTEGAHAICKSLQWGDGAAKDLLRLITKDLKNNISMAESVKQRLDAKCWKGYKKQGTKIKGGVRVNNCVPANEAANAAQQAAIAINMKKDSSKVDEEWTTTYDRKGNKVPVYIPSKDEVDEGFQDFNKVEPYAVCLAGKPIKKFDYYEDARRFHDNWKKKLYREGDKEKADKITLLPLNLDEGHLEEDKSALKLELLRLTNKALKAVAGSPKQKEIIAKIDAIRKELNGDVLEDESKAELQDGEYYIWKIYFDDGSSKRIKVLSNDFDPYKYYAKKNKNVINVEFNWDKHK